MAKAQTTKKGNLKGGPIRISQARQSFEQDVKRPAGPQGATGAPPLIKKYISRAWQLLTLNHWPA
jgi:hypothetical protein